MENKVESKEAAKPKAAPKAAKAPTAPVKAPMTAAQKLEALENSFMAQNQQIEILADEIDSLRQTLVAVNKRLNASIQAAEQGSLTGESVNKIILGDNMKELESRITFLVENGALVRSDDKEIDSMTFVVGREIDTTGNVTNPRVQFSVQSVDPQLKAQILGKKAGDVVAYSETEDSLEITEVYQITDPKTKKNFEKS
jgi:hypothetical protein